MIRDRSCDECQVATIGPRDDPEREDRQAGCHRLVHVEDVEVALADPARTRRVALTPKLSRATEPLYRTAMGRPPSATHDGRSAGSSTGASTLTS